MSVSSLSSTTDLGSLTSTQSDDHNCPLTLPKCPWRETTAPQTESHSPHPSFHDTHKWSKERAEIKTMVLGNTKVKWQCWRGAYFSRFLREPKFLDAQDSPLTWQWCSKAEAREKIDAILYHSSHYFIDTGSFKPGVGWQPASSKDPPVSACPSPHTLCIGIAKVWGHTQLLILGTMYSNSSPHAFPPSVLWSIQLSPWVLFVYITSICYLYKVRKLIMPIP